MPKPPQPAPPVIDETRVDPFPLRPAADSGSVPVRVRRGSGGAGALVGRAPAHPHPVDGRSWT